MQYFDLMNLNSVIKKILIIYNKGLLIKFLSDKKLDQNFKNIVKKHGKNHFKISIIKY